IRCFRPFPAQEFADALSSVKAVAVLDRSDSFGGLGGPIFSEIRSALYEYPSRPKICNFVYGLGGRELDLDLISRAFRKAQGLAEGAVVEPLVEYLGVRD
ncbi:pyruvate ferredoxin oxidoreductase, partial [candidate division KSB3 bacterium]|nr:pyruvate ferredoxin oxidoreductase [candidate division KSB3 bacterium]MBD3327194.1 pyruvate ferredoxin oxidoreductase [candidate division KSB3 bacterium]